MEFRDTELQRVYEKTVSIDSLAKSCPQEQIPVFALLDAWHWFRLIEGDESPRAKEAVEHLLSPELRPALRGWFQRHPRWENEKLYFREHLSELAGEKF